MLWIALTNVENHWYSRKSVVKWVQLLDSSHFSANNHLVSLAKELNPSGLSFPYLSNEQVKFRVLRSLPPRLYQSGDTFTAWREHKSLPKKEDGWGEVAEAERRTGARCSHMT